MKEQEPMYDTEDLGAAGATTEGAAAASSPTRSELRLELVRVTDALERRIELYEGAGIVAASDMAYATSRQLVVLTKWLLACEADGSAARTARTPGGTP